MSSQNNPPFSPRPLDDVLTHTPYTIPHTPYTIPHTPYHMHHTTYTIPHHIYHTTYTIPHALYHIHHTTYRTSKYSIRYNTFVHVSGTVLYLLYSCKGYKANGRSHEAQEDSAIALVRLLAWDIAIKTV